MTLDFFIRIGTILSLLGTLFGGVIAIISKKDLIQRLSQIVTMIGLALGSAASAAFLMKGIDPIAVLDTNWLFPGTLMIDHLSAIFVLIINAIGLLTSLYGLKYLINERSHYNIGYVQFLTTLFILGMQMVVLATTPTFFFFAWEVMSFSSFLLVMADMKLESMKPALFYLIMTHLGAGMILAGFLFISGGTLSIDFAQMAAAASKLPAGTLAITFILFFLGFGSKAGLLPFHGWLPEAHPQAPSHISALMSGVMLKVAVYGMLRVVLDILPVLPVQLGYTVVAAGLASAIFGVMYSVIETDIKRILAFSSIENLGLIFTMIGLFLVAKSLDMETLANISLLAALFQSTAHALFKSGLFLTAGIAVQTFHTRNIEKMGGMAKRMKLFSFAALLLCLGAAALPPSGAFISEWMMVQSIINNIGAAALSVKMLLLAILIAIGLVAGVAVFSMIRFFSMAFLAEPRSKAEGISQDPQSDLLFPVALLGFGAVLLGLIAKPIIYLLGRGLLIGDATGIPLPFSFNPPVLAAIMLGMLILAWLFRIAASDTKKERLYHTWDCGQPINATMEYTATAFSAPARFFFRHLIRAQKEVIQTPIVETNPWLVKKSIEVESNPIWDRFFYNPIVRLVHWCSVSIRSLQNGNIQFYISLILISLVITAIVTL